MEKKKYGAKAQGSIIKENRLKKMWSQKQLAEQMGTRQNNIALWESGVRKVPQKYIDKLCEVLEIKKEHFLSPFFKEIENLETQFVAPEGLLEELLKENKFKEKERFTNEFKTYLRIISENFLENGYELIAKEIKHE